MVAFLVIESRVRAPLVPLRLFRIRSLAASNVIGILWSAAMFAWFFLSALYMQLVLGYTPLEVGLAFLPANLIMAVFSLGLSAKIVMRFGIRGPLAFGMGLVTVGLALFARAPVDGIVRNRRAPQHAVPRSGRRAGVQPRAAGGNERRRSRGVGPCVWRREHGVHDGRRAGTGRAGQPGGIAHSAACWTAARLQLAALDGGYQIAFLVGAVFAATAGGLAAALLAGVRAAVRAGDGAGARVVASDTTMPTRERP